MQPYNAFLNKNYAYFVSIATLSYINTTDTWSRIDNRTCAVTKKFATCFVNKLYRSCDVDCKWFATSHVRWTFMNRAPGITHVTDNNHISSETTLATILTVAWCDSLILQHPSIHCCPQLLHLQCQLIILCTQLLHEAAFQWNKMSSVLFSPDGLTLLVR